MALLPSFAVVEAGMDWLAAANVQPVLGALFIGLFAIALLLQRVAPAT